MKKHMTEVLARKLARDFPEFTFAKSDIARWSPDSRTVFYDDSVANLLHELGHAISQHTDFVQDVELLKLERDAWEIAREIAPKYGVKIRENDIETALDAYREWLHARSLCPRCGQTGLQRREDLTYFCLNCDAKWMANDARSCGLKRRLVK